MKQSYGDALRADAKRAPEAWEARSRWAARRILTAVCFRETAESAFQKAGSILLPTIGFYYALFHMGTAALYLERCTSPDDLRRLRHSRLRNLIEARLVQTGNLPESYLSLLERLQVAREYANYVLGGKMAGDFDEPIHRDSGDDLYDRTGAEFEHTLTFIRAVSTEFRGIVDPIERIAVTIGDDIGDDVYSMYLSPDDEQRVTDYLIATRLTT